jgi:protein tyrosine/serine phosphatase
MKKSLAPVLVLFLCAGTALAAGPADRPSEWAVSVTLPGVQNLYKIEDGFYRGAQPSTEGFTGLSGLGVKTVLDLAGGDGDGGFVKDGSLKLVHVPLRAWGLNDTRVLDALRVMADPENRPLMIHCQHGADRTGALVALYRVVVQGWTKEKAVEEMNRGGYHHSSLWRNLDRYVMKADVEALRKSLKLPALANPSAAPAASIVPAATALAVVPAAP